MKTSVKSNDIIDKRVLKTILQKYGVTYAAIFGSYARGEAEPTSDLDLLVDYSEGMSLFDVIDLRTALENSLGRRVDLVSRKFMPERLAKRIKDDLVLLKLD